MPKKSLIAVIDDDESVRTALAGLMRSLEFAAEPFSSADAFLASRHFRRIACVIADVNMPRTTGLELYRHLVATGKTIPTILITAYPDDGMRTQALSEGVLCYLCKPFDEKDLLACVRSALGRHRKVAGLPRQAGSSSPTG